MSDGDHKHFDGAVQLGGGKRTTTRELLVRERTADLSVPYSELEGPEGIALGFRVEMFTLGDGQNGGSVLTGSGFGTDFIILQWDDESKGIKREAYVRGLDLLRAWVKTFAPDEIEKFPAGLAERQEVEPKYKGYGFSLRPARKNGKPNMGRKAIRDIMHARSKEEAVEMVLAKWKGYAIEESW